MQQVARILQVQDHHSLQTGEMRTTGDTKSGNTTHTRYLIPVARPFSFVQNPCPSGCHNTQIRWPIYHYFVEEIDWQFTDELTLFPLGPGAPDLIRLACDKGKPQQPIPHRFRVANIATAAAPIKTKAAHTRTFESIPLRCSPIISLLRAIRAMRKINGTAITPLITAVTTRA